MLFGKRIHGQELHAPDLYVLLASEQYSVWFSALSYCLQFLEIGLEYFPLGDIYYHLPLMAKLTLVFHLHMPALNLLFTKYNFYSQLLMQKYESSVKDSFLQYYIGRLPCLRELRNHR